MAELRVLILDDDPMVGMLIEMVAQSAGAETLRCELPLPFLDAVVSWQPTHLVLDMRMPDMNGEEVLSELARRCCAARIVLTSGSAQDAYAARQSADASLDIAGVLPKPFEAAALRALLA